MTTGKRSNDTFRGPDVYASAPDVGRFAWARVDWLILSLLALLAAVVVYKVVEWRVLPAEDALMLMRYARHVADGHGIVWNVGDKPVEGATDFLFLMALSACVKLTGLGPILAGRLLLGFCQVVSVGVLYAAARRIAGAGRAVSAVLGMYLALGLGVVHVGNGFSGPFYALMAMTAWSFALYAVKRGGAGTGVSIGFAMFALATGLTRPDGVLLAIFMTAALLYALRGASVRIVVTTVAIFAVLGGAYFAWRFHYFGHLLPNPFYKKGGGHLYPASLKLSITSVVKLLMPVLPVLVLGAIVKETRRLAIFGLIPVVCFACIWVLLTNENNAAMRFQYVVLPIGLLSGAAVWAALLEVPALESLRQTRLRVPAWGMAALGVLLLLSFHLYWHTLVFGQELVGTGPYRIATSLAKFEDRHYTIVATEAGVIPYFSRWRAIDAWGLNDAEIVHNKRGLTAEYLNANQPAIIMFHNATAMSKADYDRAWRGDAPPAENINYLVEQAGHYAVTHGYTLAARWGENACETDSWYVRSSVPEHDEMVRIIQRPDYFYPYGGAAHGTNYLEPEPPVNCVDDKDVVMDKRE